MGQLHHHIGELRADAREHDGTDGDARAGDGRNDRDGAHNAKLNGADDLLCAHAGLFFEGTAHDGGNNRVDRRPADRVLEDDEIDDEDDKRQQQIPAAAHLRAHFFEPARIDALEPRAGSLKVDHENDA
ncbi:hypothetical protein SDC9_141337 [bioreactor metagenome]|uniref:Uncharacterized protein n=1 Tax=bioreactor metagenome TaxID=1076179 RepID=A0A645E0S9_9ZZZZ